MTLSIEYFNFQISSSFEIPESLRQLLYKAWQNHYQELYEEADGTITLEETLLEILDDCLEGYAIFPGSQGRRDLFNWWLLEVVPATWCLQFPESIYRINSIIPFNSNFHLTLD
jgi:hypothetical protein